MGRCGSSPGGERGSGDAAAFGVEVVEVGGVGGEVDGGAALEAGLAGEDGEEALAVGGGGVEDGFGAERLDEA